MVKTKKRVYYPTVLYYPIRKTKKIKKKDDFTYTFANNFIPSDLMKPPKKKIKFSKFDSLNQFSGNILDLYNIDYNPNFLNFSLNNFQTKISEYLKIIRNEDFYLNSVNKIKLQSDVKELKSIFNEHELHLLLENLDFLLEYSKVNKNYLKNFKTNSEKFLKKK